MSEIQIGDLKTFPDNDYRIIAVDSLEVGVFRRGKKLYAYENTCPHYGGPVCQGKILRRVEENLAADKTSRGLRFASEEHIICPWHGVEFDLKTGRNRGHAHYRLRSIAIKVRGGKVYLDIPQ
jgi:nitrite reductase (NADH) small subunit